MAIERFSDLKPCEYCHRPPVLSRKELQDFIVHQVDQYGSGWSYLAYYLEFHKIPTAQGGKEWRASSVQALYRNAKK